ncbi:MAG: branched-chain amino acid ABC transporter permease [Chloroflexota bacterium]
MEILRALGLSETALQFMLVNSILGLSIYLPLYTGMFSLANAGFMAIGAYAGVLVTQQLGLPLGVGLIAGMLVAGLIALPIGLPVLRLRDLYLAIATIGFGEVVNIILLNFDNFAGSVREALTGYGTRFALINGARGIRGIPKTTETWHLVLFLILASYFIVRLHRSRFGRAMAAVRQDERVAANMGINTVHVKSVVFILSAMLAGAAGVFSGHLTRIITPDMAQFTQAVDILAYAVLGGTSSFLGPIVGGLVLGALPEVLRFLAQYRGVFNGLVLLLVIVYLPGGLVNPVGWRRVWRRLRREKSLTSSP